MKIIDLLNKIANGEEVPKKIKYRKCIFEYEEKYKDYFTKDGIIPTIFDTNGIFRNIFLDYNNFLNDEVEIIEEGFTQEEINECANKFLEVWKPVKKQFGKLFDEITRIDNNFNLEDESEEEKKIPEKLYFHDLENITKNEKILVGRINSILDYLKSKGE